MAPRSYEAHSPYELEVGVTVCERELDPRWGETLTVSAHDGTFAVALVVTVRGELVVQEYTQRPDDCCGPMIAGFVNLSLGEEGWHSMVSREEFSGGIDVPYERLVAIEVVDDDHVMGSFDLTGLCTVDMPTSPCRGMFAGSFDCDTELLYPAGPGPE